MYGLKLACEFRNLVALGVKLSAQQLAELNVPSIVLIRRRHFVSVLPIREKNSLLIVDPSSDPYYVKAEDFPKSHDWKGETLVIAKSKDNLPEYLKKGAQWLSVPITER